MERFITAKRAGTCRETGRAFQRGDTILWCPGERQAYHEASERAREARARQFSKAWNMGDSDW